MISKMSRRALLFGSVAGFAASAGGAAVLAVYDDSDLVRSSLRRMLGEFRMPQADMNAFTSLFRATWAGLDGAKGPLMRGVEALGATDLAARYGPSSISRRVETYERELLTLFIVTTDYLRVADPRRENVSFTGLVKACTNPFARFEPDEGGATNPPEATSARS